MLIDIETDPLANQPTTSISLPQKQRSFGHPSTTGTSPAKGAEAVRIQLPKSALKTSKVSFEREQYSSDEDDFSGRRHHFQGKGPQKSDNIDHKSILKVSEKDISIQKKRKVDKKKVLTFFNYFLIKYFPRI